MNDAPHQTFFLIEWVVKSNAVIAVVVIVWNFIVFPPPPLSIETKGTNTTKLTKNRNQNKLMDRQADNICSQFRLISISWSSESGKVREILATIRTNRATTQAHSRQAYVCWIVVSFVVVAGIIYANDNNK